MAFSGEDAACIQCHCRSCACYEFVSAAGDRLGVLIHRLGQRHLLVYSQDDPDACMVTARLEFDEARTLAESFGAATASEQVTAMQQQVAGLTIDWLSVDPASPLVGASLRDAAIHTRTGVSVVGVLRGDQAFPAPTAEFRFKAGDIAVSVGTTEGRIAQLTALVRPAR